MYKREEITRTKKQFWTTFGQYMKPVPSAEGGRVNWQNYKTGVKHIFFRMRAERNFVSIGIEINHPDTELQELVFEQLREFKKMLHAILGEDWEWKLHDQDEFGKITSMVEKKLKGPSVMNKDDWPQIISFLKPRIIALDEFWGNIKPAFEEL
ncbi:DUF4268 domain-containing protein [Echinicola jeungdonensis]|uniref:DUF4268 domain-containing protein n=1 Tax=Echinicola jeungdonensis TaxID=709343 RepID=A0ABV5J1P4_9BACT|nr:DUF4268 domain-containing protein [Echinicola jeungdonensis]MDN3668272.1 DUF4268 domain-containing protein [Echinicola jeungdonensis]